ncbi:cation-translocating P-type ATPase [Sporohalobacter salinus]|uniref:cation-translocating P-type ATPase n=1 Tax=Sporohalobacter salinus TaxID=1494606 RepID=UPI001962102F|nr:cation-translocating P-type ATPase [Sporohalobacter salinus]MBM7623437.1 Ca2+-transporting ATPase [Sporohalobacter salinus]
MADKEWYYLKASEVLEELETNREEGLTIKIARKRLDKYGRNIIQKKNQRTLYDMFLDQFKNFLVIILLLAAVISGIVGEIKDTIVISVIVILNSVLGVFQENKAEESLQALRRMETPTAQILRQGKWREIDSKELVPGDVIELKTGDAVSADARIISADNLKVQEAVLTGESTAVEKNTGQRIEKEDLALSDQANMLFKGTTVISGRAKAVVVATGMDTEFGKIATMIQNVSSEQTPLQKRLERLSKKLGIGVLFISAFILVLGVWRGESLFEMFMTGITLAVAAIPEGLPAVVTIVLALGVQRMIENNAIIRRLPAVETLGSATAICSDKTGTLTQNEMVVKEIYLPNKDLIQVSGSGYQPQGEFKQEKDKILPADNEELELLLKISILCNHAELNKTEDGQWRVLGDPTEGALLTLGLKGGLKRKELLQNHRLEREIEFNSDRKLMTTIYNTNNQLEALVKGAPNVLLGKTDKVYSSKGIKELSDKRRQELLELNKKLASKGRRVLALAWRQLDNDLLEVDSAEIEKELVFVGFVSIIDPPRPEVKEAVAECKDAGVKPIMITGDHKATAKAIADEIDLTEDRDLVLSGNELENMIDAEFAQRVNQIGVYARVTPKHKMRIVNTLQQRNHIVAMTGDGVNDAPALKKADIGIAMGDKGTDVAKESSDLILTDDNFATIVTAIKEGRAIFDNIKKAVKFLLSCNLGEIFTLLVALMIGFKRPLIPIQILWVNLVTDSLPALALGLENPELGLMNRAPQNPNSGVLSSKEGWSILGQGVLIGSLSLVGYWLGLQNGNLAKARTMAFTVLALAQLAHAFNLRSNKSLLEIGLLSNRYLVGGVLISVLLQIIVLITPFLQQIFEVVALGANDWGIVLGLSIIPILVVEIFKQII